MTGPGIITHRLNVREEVKLMGRTSPKGAMHILALHSVHHTEQYWPQHDKFIPERFLPVSRATPTDPRRCHAGVATFCAHKPCSFQVLSLGGCNHLAGVIRCDHWVDAITSQV
jgi:cytochrome P450